MEIDTSEKSPEKQKKSKSKRKKNKKSLKSKKARKTSAFGTEGQKLNPTTANVSYVTNAIHRKLKGINRADFNTLWAFITGLTRKQKDKKEELGEWQSLVTKNEDMNGSVDDPTKKKKRKKKGAVATVTELKVCLFANLSLY